MVDEHISEWTRKYLLQLEELNKTFEASIKPILEQQARMTAQLRSTLIEQSIPIHDMQKILTQKSAYMALWAEMMQTNISTSVLEATARITKNIVMPFTSSFLETLERLPARMRKALITFGKNGWYLDIEMPFPDLWDYEAAFEEGRIEEADAGLSSYFESRVDEIEVGIIQRFSHRKEIICDAFKAHKASDYNTAIPVFFAQTDGICKDIFGRCLFYSNKSTAKPFSTLIIERVASDTIVETLISLLDEDLPVKLSESKRGDNFTALNRHLVMHGESLDYGTKTNSLKAVSLLNYITIATKDA
jgi:hypothetical protein